MRARMEPGFPEAVLAAISQSTNELTQGWMRLMASAPPPVDASWFGANSALQASYLEKQAKLWGALIDRSGEQIVSPEPSDLRFAHPQWSANPYYDYLKQSYLLASRYLAESVEQTALEPLAQEQALETRGESLARGLGQLLADAQRGRISQTDESAFEVGRNLAVTPGSVVFENELVQLIQYAPSTAEVARRPLVIVPPCINKYY